MEFRGYLRPITATVIAAGFLVGACSVNSPKSSEPTSSAKQPETTPTTVEAKEKCHSFVAHILPNNLIDVVPVKGSHRNVAYQLSSLPAQDGRKSVQILQLTYVNSKIGTPIGGQTINADNRIADMPEQFGTAEFTYLNPNATNPDIDITTCDVLSPQEA